MRADELTAGTRVRDQDGNVEVIVYVAAADHPSQCLVRLMDARGGFRGRTVARSQLFEVVPVDPVVEIERMNREMAESRARLGIEAPEHRHPIRCGGCGCRLFAGNTSGRCADCYVAPDEVEPVCGCYRYPDVINPLCALHGDAEVTS